jgi:hypothetical protein
MNHAERDTKFYIENRRVIKVEAMKNQNIFRPSIVQILSNSSLFKSIFISTFAILYCGCMNSNILKLPGASENTQYVRIYNLDEINDLVIDGVSVPDKPGKLSVPIGPHKITGKVIFTYYNMVKTKNVLNLSTGEMRGEWERRLDHIDKFPINISYDFKEGDYYRFASCDADGNGAHIETYSPFWQGSWYDLDFLDYAVFVVAISYLFIKYVF